jgi:hypothetical protein
MPDEKFRCVLGPLTLCVRYKSPKLLDLRVVHRQATGSSFESALTVRQGTVLTLRRKREVRFVRAKVFAPRIQYGRCVAGGVLEIF